MWLEALLSLSMLFWIIFAFITLYNSKNFPMASSKGKKFSGLASIIIPCRNEERRIGKCVKSLREQSYKNFEVIVVDDSTDRTVEVIKEETKGDDRFRIVKQDKLPEGWLGKSFALQQGSKLAKGKYLVFIDADVYLEKNALEEALGFALKKNVDMLSLAPKHICKTFWENVIQPIPLCSLALLSPPAKINDPKSEIALAAGPFIAIKREVFEKIGGYAAIKDKIADDAELAKLVKKKGFRLIFAKGQHLLELRMYEGLRDAWEGWSKVSFAGFVQKREIKSKFAQVVLFLLIMFIMIVSFPLPFASLLISIPLHLRNAFFLSLMAFSMSVLSMAYAQRVYKIGDPAYAPLVILIGGILMIGIVTNSAIRTLLGKGVRWKGKTYMVKVK